MEYEGVDKINLNQLRYKNRRLHTNSCCSGKGLVANYCEHFYNRLGTLWLAEPLSFYQGYSNPCSLSYRHIACEKLKLSV
jgi:hypothetical protein